MNQVPTIIALFFITACSAVNPATPTPAPVSQVNQPKRLATVFISPTPNEAERQATRIASTPTENPFPTDVPTSTPTVYVGVFLGESAVGAPAVGIGQNVAAPPTITPIQTRCLIDTATDAFGTAWQDDIETSRALGCAIEGAIPFVGATQTFENGVMAVRPNGEMWAFTVGEGGRWWVLETAPAPTDQFNVEPPSGLLAPSELFAAMWLGVDGVRDALGFAVFGQVDARLTIQRFEGGTLLYDDAAGQTYAFMLNQEVRGPY
ncbi:MAG: hypothetical protein AAFR22_22585 [Chloroflexota bacterium]